MTVLYAPYVLEWFRSACSARVTIQEQLYEQHGQSFRQSEKLHV